MLTVYYSMLSSGFIAALLWVINLFILSTLLSFLWKVDEPSLFALFVQGLKQGFGILFYLTLILVLFIFSALLHRFKSFAKKFIILDVTFSAIIIALSFISSFSPPNSGFGTELVVFILALFSTSTLPVAIASVENKDNTAKLALSITFWGILITVIYNLLFVLSTLPNLIKSWQP